MANTGKEKFTKKQNNTILVELLLLHSHVNTEDLFHLGRQRFFHIFLDTTQKERLKDFMETLITIIPSFPVFVLKILPGVKPVGEKTNVTHTWVSQLSVISNV